MCSARSWLSQLRAKRKNRIQKHQNTTDLLISDGKEQLCCWDLYWTGNYSNLSYVYQPHQSINPLFVFHYSEKSAYKVIFCYAYEKLAEGSGCQLSRASQQSSSSQSHLQMALLRGERPGGRAEATALWSIVAGILPPPSSSAFQSKSPLMDFKGKEGTRK